ncbi:MAG TPA: alanine racemase [Gemmatimonadales bacterium]|nr:alanine racemase [Gemmatimonadales bacterium]
MELAGIESVRSPALLLDAEQVDRNIAATLELLGAAERWRPHLKTAKLAWTMRKLRDAGVAQSKCATALELETACAAGFEDVLLAYPAVGPTVQLIREIARRHPAVRISALVESEAMVAAWQGGQVGLFVDVNPGMDRTGAAPEPERILPIVRSIERAGLSWRGLHYYDGLTAGSAVHAGYDALLGVAARLRREGHAPAEIVTAGTPAFPAACAYRNLTEAGYLHRLSPGTVVYCDVRSLEQLPAGRGYGAAAFVLSRVVSHPAPSRIACDAGHKTVSADAGDPTCLVAGHPDWTPRHPSEEHLPIDLPAGAALPPRGTPFLLVPMHVCPTVNNFDQAVLIAGGAVQRVERVTARGRHAPLE